MAAGADGDDGTVGALVTLELPADSPVGDLPWIITIGPLDDEDEWEPVVVGPYERPHALALAESVVADDDLMAVVEPLLPLTTVDAIRGEVQQARAAADEDDPYPPDDGDRDGDAGDDAGPGGTGVVNGMPDGRHIQPSTPPDEAQVRAGFARIAARLTAD